MKKTLSAQLQQENILKIKALRLQKSTEDNEYLLSVCAQCRGDSGFEWLTHACRGAEQMLALFARLAQLHLWSAPEDLEILRYWRSCLDKWLDASDEKLELEDESIQPFLLDMIVMRPS